jgi:hypothetical protein
MEQFQRLGKTPTNPNSVWEELKSRLESWNACYLSVQEIVSSNSLSKYVHIRYTEL